MSIAIKLKVFLNQEGTNKYLKNTSLLFFEKVLRMTVGLFVSIWVARYLGPEQFGLFNYAQSFVALFTAIATLGLDGIIVRELVKNEKIKNKLLGTAFLLKFGGAFFVLLLIFVALSLQEISFQEKLLTFIIASAIIFQSFNVIDFYFQSKVLSKYVVYSNTVTLFLSSILKIILILNEAPLLSFAFVILIDSVILILGYLYFYTKKIGFINKWQFDLSIAKKLLTDSWPLIFSSIVVSIYMKVDQVMIGQMMNNESVGLYAAAIRLSEPWYFIPVVIASSLFPSIINAKKQSKALYKKRFQLLNDFMVWSAICVALPVTLLSDVIIQTLYGNEYALASSVLVIHIWASIFVFITVSSGKFLTADNLVKKVFYRNLAGLVINLILNYYFIPLYGIQGAAVTTLISWFVAGYLYDLFDKDLRYMFLIKSKSFNPFHLISYWKKQ